MVSAAFRECDCVDDGDVIMIIFMFLVKLIVAFLLLCLASVSLTLVQLCCWFLFVCSWDEGCARCLCTPRRVALALVRFFGLFFCARLLRRALVYPRFMPGGASVLSRWSCASAKPMPWFCALFVFLSIYPFFSYAHAFPYRRTVRCVLAITKSRSISKA